MLTNLASAHLPGGVLRHRSLEVLESSSSLTGGFDLDAREVISELVDDEAVLALHTELLEGGANFLAHYKTRLHSDIYL